MNGTRRRTLVSVIEELIVSLSLFQCLKRFLEEAIQTFIVLFGGLQI